MRLFHRAAVSIIFFNSSIRFLARSHLGDSGKAILKIDGKLINQVDESTIRALSHTKFALIYQNSRRANHGNDTMNCK